MKQPRYPSTQAQIYRPSGSPRCGPWMLAGAALFFSPLLLMKASAATTSTAQVEFIHPGEGGSPGYSNTGVYSAEASGNDPEADDLYFGSGYAAVTFNGTILPALHADASASPGNPEGPSSIATFSTDFTFTPTALSLTQSTLFQVLIFSVDGELSGNASAYLTVAYGNSSVTETLVSGQEEIKIPVSISGVVYDGTMTYQAPFSDSLTADANNIDSEGGSTGIGVASFQDTAQLTGIDVTDANGNPVAGTFTDGGQISFAANTQLTPEPSTTALLASSALLLAFLMKRRFRAA